MRETAECGRTVREGEMMRQKKTKEGKIQMEKILIKKALMAILLMLLILVLPAREANAAQTLLTKTNFDSVRYAQRYPDLQAAFGNDAKLLFEHYLRCGFAEGREGHSTSPEVEALLNGTAAERYTLIVASIAAYSGAASVPAELLAKQKIYSYYKNSLFIGDSITLAFSEYCAASDDPMTEGMHFIAQNGYSMRDEFAGSGRLPVYRWDTANVFAAAATYHPDRIFIALGINDLMKLSVHDTELEYVRFVQELHRACPYAEIHFVSVNYIFDESRGVTNSSVIKLNSDLKQFAAGNGLGYVPLADELSDGRAKLRRDYCSDGWLHQNAAAYDIWLRVLRSYAL